ncbi:unnamed protein product [Gulo gulo]|uniref:Uncharacterized protein n=1 Tax=Gulo gulo TaxID=48420 RepID=A0A9X9LLR3_GULGU|nr:unnamed protein product [Gulo gulo]
MLPRHRAFSLHCRPSVAPMSLPRQAGAFIYDHLGRVEQTYVAKGRLFLFIKFMASPRLHTVKTGRIGPKVSCRMTASDVRTSVNSVGAVEEDKVDDSSKACCPVTRCGQSASRKGVRGCAWKGRGSGSAGGRATWHQDPAPSWLWTLSGQLQVAERERKNPQGSGHRTRQLESSGLVALYLQASTRREKWGLSTAGGIGARAAHYSEKLEAWSNNTELIVK